MALKMGSLKRNGWSWIVGFPLGEKDDVENIWWPSFEHVIAFFISLSLWSLTNYLYSLLFTMHDAGHQSDQGVMPHQ